MLIFEWHPYGTLHDVLKENKDGQMVSIEQLLQYAISLCDGLTHLHSIKYGTNGKLDRATVLEQRLFRHLQAANGALRYQKLEHFGQNEWRMLLVGLQPRRSLPSVRSLRSLTRTEIDFFLQANAGDSRRRHRASLPPRRHQAVHAA